VINPHVEGGAIDTTYGTNSFLPGAKYGDVFTFVPMIFNNATFPKQAGNPIPFSLYKA
jgi:hypothetical protein